MAKTFRLIHASGGFERRDLLNANAARQRPFLDVAFAESPRDLYQPSWVTVLIGKNGVGKSRLLAGIANMFDAIERGTGRKRRDDHLLSHLTYSCDNIVCDVVSDGAYRISASINGEPCPLSDLPLPSRVIALTTTPFDKFRVPASVITRSGIQHESRELYAYLGLRDRSGRASTTAAIFRALEGLFEASRSDIERRARVAEVFGFLGYRPSVEITYELSNIGIIEQLVHGEPVEKLRDDDGRKGIYLRPFDRLVERDPSIINEMREISREALDRSKDGRVFRVRVDFEGMSPDDSFTRHVQLLRRAGLLRMRAVEIQRSSDGTVLDLKLASSGELGIVTGFLGLASVIEDGSLIFIDEPEISLHPEWQTRYVDLLRQTFGAFRGCHFILATHSPLILSDISPDTSNVVSLDPNRGQAEDADEFAGQSSDYLLVNAFHVAGKNNLYLKQEVIKALRLAAEGKASSQEFTETVSAMVELLPSMDADSPVANLIRELQSAGKASLTAS